MRLWTLHPRYLDPQGLVALWREALLAQRVLAGRTRGYRHHPQLLRFRACDDPPAAIATFLHAVCDEAERRGYSFDRARVERDRSELVLDETAGQLRFEREHLRRKLAVRRPEGLPALVRRPLQAHPLFRIVPGPVREWEKAADGSVTKSSR